VAAPARQARSALAFVLSKDFVRAAVARGASRTRAVVAHGLRNAMLPVVTLAALEAPIVLGGAFVVERVFGLPGLGEATIRAVAERDTSWLMALSIFTAAGAAVGVIVTDLAYAVIDPRLASAVFSRSGRA
jgi:ABC-type dipeptide/oligopeptide/nickel transport system permease component